jgi:hypothetical protein
MPTRCGGRLRPDRCCERVFVSGRQAGPKRREGTLSGPLCLWVVLLRKVAVPSRFVGFRFGIPL